LRNKQTRRFPIVRDGRPNRSSASTGAALKYPFIHSQLAESAAQRRGRPRFRFTEKSHWLKRPSSQTKHFLKFFSFATKGPISSPRRHLRLRNTLIPSADDASIAGRSSKYVSPRIRCLLSSSSSSASPTRPWSACARLFWHYFTHAFRNTSP